MQCSYQNYQLTHISCSPVALTLKKKLRFKDIQIRGETSEQQWQDH